MDENVNLLLENETLKKEFALRNLSLYEIFTPTPDALERENYVLKNLLDWVQKYSECHDRKKMEAEGYEFPPIDFCITPENDWYIFERWMNGLPVRSKYKDLLPKNYVMKNPEELNDEEILIELQKLTDALEELGSSIGLNEGIPARLVYAYLLETLEEENEMLIDGGWTNDGCSGYCPDCFQRPWCKSGGQLCWPEDVGAGKMFLIDSAKKYVSASPVSLQILQKCQAEEDKKFKDFEMGHNKNDVSIDPIAFHSDDDNDEIPF